MAPDREPAVPAPVRGGDRGGRQADGDRRDRGQESSTTTKIYDPETDSWTTGPGLPLALHHFSAVTYEGEAVVIGGFIPGEELTSEQSDRVYVPCAEAPGSSCPR